MVVLFFFLTQCIHDNGRRTYGHSMIVNPWGKVLVEAKYDKKQVISKTINISEVQEYRKNSVND